MRILVLTGEDMWAVRARRAAEVEALAVAASAVERFDLSADGGAELVRAASTLSLFGGTRVLVAEPAADLTESCAATLAQCATDVHVILWGAAALPAAVRRALGEHALLETFPVPKGRAIDARVDAVLLSSGVRLSPAARRAVLQRAATDLPRALSTLTQLQNMALLDPTDSQVERLLGTSAAVTTPWALADALDAGDLSGALEMASSAEPVATIAYLSSRIGQAARILDEGIPDNAAIAAWFGWASTAQAAKLASLARRLGPRGIATSFDLIAAADRNAKLSREPLAVLDVLLVKLCDLWAAPRA